MGENINFSRFWVDTYGEFSRFYEKVLIFDKSECIFSLFWRSNASRCFQYNVKSNVLNLFFIFSNQGSLDLFWTLNEVINTNFVSREIKFETKQIYIKNYLQHRAYFGFFDLCKTSIMAGQRKRILSCGKSPVDKKEICCSWFYFFYSVFL